MPEYPDTLIWVAGVKPALGFIATFSTLTDYETNRYDKNQYHPSFEVKDYAGNPPPAGIHGHLGVTQFQ